MQHSGCPSHHIVTQAASLISRVAERRKGALRLDVRELVGAKEAHGHCASAWRVCTRGDVGVVLIQHLPRQRSGAELSRTGQDTPAALPVRCTPLQAGMLSACLLLALCSSSRHMEGLTSTAESTHNPSHFLEMAVFLHVCRIAMAGRS